MNRIKSKSDKRLIIEGLVNGKPACFLVDTGASVGLIHYDKRKEYDLLVGRRYNGTLVGAGGEMRNIRYCDTFVPGYDPGERGFLCRLNGCAA